MVQSVRGFLSNNRMNWRECDVIGESENAIQVHYISYHSKYDEWVDKNSDRIQVERKVQELKKGDNLSAWNPEVSAWTEVEVESIDLERKKVKITFVGTKNAAFVPLSSPNLSFAHKKTKDPYNGSPDDYEWVTARVNYTDKPQSVEEDAQVTTNEPKKSVNEDQTQANLQNQQAPAAKGCCQIL